MEIMREFIARSRARCSPNCGRGGEPRPGSSSRL